jgi:beta-hydroxylase
VKHFGWLLRIPRIVGYAALILLFLPLYVFVRTVELLMSRTRGGRRTFFPRETYSWVDQLESSWKPIRSELDQVLTNLDAVPSYHELSPEQAYLIRDDKWKSMIFSVFGRPIARNCALCPETARAVSEIPGLIYAMFSILKPGTHIAAHRGPYAGALNCHLALKVPEREEEARLRVGQDIRSWKEGKVFIFNDRHEHEAWNDSDTTRAVLLMYVVRPLPFPLSGLNWLVMAIGRRSSRVRDLVQRANEPPAPATRVA